MKRRLAISGLAIALVAGCMSQDNPKYDAAEKVYEQVQADRGKANELAFDYSNGKKVKPLGLKAGILAMESVAKRLEQAEIEELAKDHKWLGWKIHDIYRDLVTMYAYDNDEAGAVAVMNRLLKKCRESDGERGQVLKEGGVFSRMIWRSDAPVMAMISKNGAFAARYREYLQMAGFGLALDNGALSSPYKSNLSNEEKIAGLAQFWSMAKYNFVYLDKIDFDWNTVMTEYTPRVLKTRSTYEYYRVLQSLCARLKDGHTNVYLPSQDFQTHQGGRPPIRTALIEGQVVVTNVFSPEVPVLEPGDIITHIGGVPTIQYAEKAWGPYACSSTPQDREARLFSYDLLRGPEKSAVTLTIHRADGSTREVKVPRSGYKTTKGESTYAFNIRPDGVAYVRFSTCEDPSLVTKLKSDLESHKDIKGLVIDLRMNGGGSSSIGAQVVTGLARQGFTVPATTYQTRLYSPTKLAWGNRQGLSPVSDDTDVLEPPKVKWFDGPCALLIGPRTFSAAEDWTGYWRAANVGPVVGMPTGGSTGQPLSFNLPGGGSARVCTKQDLLPDGTKFVGVGIQPDIQVPWTVADVRAGRDPQLERAVHEVLKSR
ncbi:MAG: S41 family peptidase [Armatimonadota bacterium]